MPRPSHTTPRPVLAPPGLDRRRGASLAGPRRWLAPTFGLLLLPALAAGSIHCDNGATGVEACRSIETKRCRAAPGCITAIVDEDDVTACELFYRDQCLFGLADGVEPDSIAIDACLKALDQAIACKGVGASFAECPGAPALAPGVAADTTSCDAIVHPEKLAACAFLAPAPAGSGGAGGSAAGGAGGSAGAGGAAGAGG